MREREDVELHLSPRDRYYLNSPGFESYMIAGYVFVFGLTLSIVLTVMTNTEPLFWPGSLLTVAISFIVLQVLKRREYKAKLREIRQNPVPQTPVKRARTEPTE